MGMLARYNEAMSLLTKPIYKLEVALTPAPWRTTHYSDGAKKVIVLFRGEEMRNVEVKQGIYDTRGMEPI